MAMPSTGTKIVPESASKLMGGLNLSIVSSDCEEVIYGAWSSASKAAGHPQSASDSLSSRAIRAPKEMSLHSIDVNCDSSSSSTHSYKSKLPMVLEESESLSHREGSSTWDNSSLSSLSSITSSSASSTRAFFHKGADKVRKPKKLQKFHKRRDHKETSLLSLLLWPLKKVRDGYMRCIMGLDGAGDLSGLAQGSTFASSAKYFADLPVSKTDSRNHG